MSSLPALQFSRSHCKKCQPYDITVTGGLRRLTRQESLCTALLQAQSCTYAQRQDTWSTQKSWTSPL